MTGKRMVNTACVVHKILGFADYWKRSMKFVFAMFW